MRININLGALKNDLQQASAKLNISMNAIVVMAVREWLKKNGFLN